jgi:cytochrome c biogenesis protein CcmG/thiol:disulfide interchange protein DsbE
MRNAAPEIVELQTFLNGMTSSVMTPAQEASSDQVPDVELATLPPYREEWGDTLRLHDFAGRIPLVVNVWASWCPPCRREAPLLEAAWQTYRDRVQFIGINLRDSEDAALAFIQEFNQTFPSGADPRGYVADAFGLVGVPTTYFIDASGRIDTTKVGEITEEELALRIQALFPTQAP